MKNDSIKIMIQLSAIPAAAILLLLVLFNINPAFAYSNPDANNTAKELLNEYYSPENCLDTCMYNITYGYSRQPYSDQDQLDNIYGITDEITSDCQTDEETFLAIHDWICTNINYNINLSYTGYPYDDSANPFTVFKKREGVCYGFANLTQLMCQRAGVPCVIIRGNRSTHVWNAVYVNGQWHFTDNTWDANKSQATGNISYEFYLMNDSKYNSNYATTYIENWEGDCCYFPIVTNPNAPYHTITIDPNGGTAKAYRIPYSESQGFIFLPKAEKEGRTFRIFKSDPQLSGYSYGAGWYAEGTAPMITSDVTFKVLYNLVKPDYEVPTGLRGKIGQTLSEITLPQGFTFSNPDTVLNTAGRNKMFYAKYTPEDTDEYQTVNAIKIYIDVGDDPAITVQKRELCLDEQFDLSKIVKVNDAFDGDITSQATVSPATVDTSSVGTQTITVTVTNSLGFTATKEIELTISDHCWRSTYTIDKQATCQEEGSKSKHCIRCDTIKEGSVVVIPIQDHQYGSWQVTSEATCTEDGERVKECTWCGKTVTETVAAGHLWSRGYIVDKKPTCTKEGEKSLHCSRCGMIKEGTVTVIPKTQHQYTAWKTVQKATCTKAGVKERTCSVCKIKQTAKINATGHTWKTFKTAAGLLKDGKQYDQCTKCSVKRNTKVIAGYATYYVKSFKAKKGKKSFTAKWKKQSKANQKKFDGYQIRYSTRSDMSGAKFATAGKASKSKKIKGLAKKTKYFVQVRTYTKSGNKTFYSKWSGKKSVKTK